MKVVLDTSAVIAGLQLEDGSDYYTTEEVIREVHNPNQKLKLELLRSERKLKVDAPNEKHILKVKKKMSSLGEDESLSDADVSVLALARQLKEKWGDVILATDDFGVQNVAAALSIRYAGIAERGIKKVLAWHFICSGCGQCYDKDVVICEICGSRVKRRVKR